jgi:outer membrane protein assembly factor BamB
VAALRFEDVSDAVGLGAGGIAGGLKGEHLVVADFNGDGRPDIVLFSAGRGVLMLNTPQGFVEAKDAGLAYQPGGGAPAVGDFNGDGKLDLFIPQRGGGRLFRGDGAGHFSDATAQAGDLAKPLGDVHCAAWAEFRKGFSDLFVGCWKGPNRYFRNNGDGTFTDATEPSGLLTQIFNTSHIAMLSAGKNNVPELVLNNEGQEAMVLRCNKAWFTAPPQVAQSFNPEPTATAPTRVAVEGGMPSRRSRVGMSFVASTCLPATRESMPPDAVKPGRDTNQSDSQRKTGMSWDDLAALEAGYGTEADAAVSPWLYVSASILAAFLVGVVFILRRCAGQSCSIDGLTLLLLAAILLPAGLSRAADWPTVRGNPQRTGNVDDLPGPKSPNVSWVYKTMDHFVATPVPAGKTIYLPTVGALNTGGFMAVALAPQATERLLWSKTVPYITRPTVCAPAVAEGLVVFGDGMHQTDDAFLYCLQAETGLPLWQYPLPGKLVHLEAAPTIDRGRVYLCGGDAGVLCIDAKRVTLAGKEQDLAQVVPALMQARAEQLAKYEQEKKKDALLAIPPSDDALPKPVPKLLWQQGKGKWHIDAPPLVAGDFVLVASAYLEEDKVGKRCLACLKAADGALLWETPLALNPWSGPTLAGQLVLVGCSTVRFDRKLLDQARGEVLALDLASGQIRWRESVAGGVLSPIAVKGQTAVYTATDGKVTGRNFATGQLLWTYQAKHALFAGPAIAGDAVYAADLNAGIYALGLADGRPQWTFNAATDPAIQSRSMVFGSPVVHGGDLYVATCNLDGDADQPSYIVCLSDKRSGGPAAGGAIAVDAEKRTVTIACRVAPRKLPTLTDIYPLEVIATYPTPRGQKAHETIVTFECKPSEVHKALESLGMKPGKPVRGNGVTPSGPEVRLLLEVPCANGRPRLIPIEKLMIDTRTGKTMPPLVWRFTGSVMRQPDPEKEERVYGADLSGTLISLLPVTDETVCQAHLTMEDGELVKLETRKDLLPPEGAEVKLVIEAK